MEWLGSSCRHNFATVLIGAGAVSIGAGISEHLQVEMWWDSGAETCKRSVSSTLPMCWEGGWEWARLTVALDVRKLDSYSYSYSYSYSCCCYHYP